jgi:hypothetical protein
MSTRVQDLLFLRFDYGETNLFTESGGILEYIQRAKMNVDEANTFVNNQAKLAWVALLEGLKPRDSVTDRGLEWFSASYEPFTLSKELMKTKPKRAPLRKFRRQFDEYYNNVVTSVRLMGQAKWTPKQLLTVVHFGLSTEQVREALKSAEPGTMALFFNSEKGVAYGARTGILLATKNTGSVSVTAALRPDEVTFLLKDASDKWKDLAKLYTVEGKLYSVEKALKNFRLSVPKKRFERVGARAAAEGEESASDQRLSRWLV